MGRDELKTGAILSYINILVKILMGFIIVPFVVKSLGSGEYGVYALTGSIVGYMTILDFGMHNAIIRYVARYNAINDKKEQASFLGASFLIYSFASVLLVIIGVILYNNLSLIFADSLAYGELELLKRLYIILLINLFVGLPGSVFSAVIIGHERFIFSRSVLLIKILLRAILITFILILGLRSVGLVIVELLLELLLILISSIYCFRSLKISIKFDKLKIEYFKSILSYTSFVFIASIAYQITWNADSIILGIMTNTTIVAVYAIGMQLIYYFKSFTGAISNIFLPKATKMVALGYSDSDLTDLMIKVGRYQLIIVGLILTGFIFVGKQFIHLWVGDQYEMAYYIFLLVGFSLLIPACQSIGNNILEAKNIHRFTARAYIVVALINIVITVILVRYLNVIGAALGTTISLLLGNVLIINWYYNKKAGLDIKKYFVEVFLVNGPWIILSAGICLIIFSIIPFPVSWTGIALKAVIITLVYITAVYFKLLNDNEKSMIKSFIKKLFQKGKGKDR